MRYAPQAALTGNARRIASSVYHATVQFRLQASNNSRIVEPFFGAETGTVFGTASLSDVEPRAGGREKTL
jgi:hypothetical protein